MAGDRLQGAEDRNNVLLCSCTSTHRGAATSTNKGSRSLNGHITGDLFSNIQAAHNPRSDLDKEFNWSRDSTPPSRGKSTPSIGLLSSPVEGVPDLFDSMNMDFATMNSTLQDFIADPDITDLDPTPDWFDQTDAIFTFPDQDLGFSQDLLDMTRDNQTFPGGSMPPLLYPQQSFERQSAMFASTDPSGCKCLMTSLGLCNANPDIGESTDTWDLQQMVLQNERNADELSEMLRCRTCTKDNYRLVIMTLACFKMLHNYEIAVRHMAKSQLNRAVAHDVLTELFRLRWLVDRLSARLQSTTSSGGANARSPPRSELESEPLSEATRSQLQHHMTKRLRTLSGTIVELFKDGDQ